MENIVKRIKLNKSNYVERDVSWNYFNYRIIKEAEDKNVPLLERLLFLGIYSNNQDEYFKVRVAQLKKIAESASKSFKEDKALAKKELKEIFRLTKDYSKEFNITLQDIFSELEQKGIYLLNENNVTKSQKEYLKDYFLKNISLYINPIIISKKANLSSVNDTHIYLAIKMEGKKESFLDDVTYALIPLPVHFCGRFINVPSEEKDKYYYIYLDDVIRLNLDYIFKNLPYEKYEAYAFKFSKDAEMDVESDPEEGILKSISEAVKERKKGIPVRVVFGENIPKDLYLKLIKKFEIDDLDIVSIGGKYHNNKDLMKFPRLNIKGISYEQWERKEIPEVINGDSLLEKIQDKEMLIHVPYQSFNAFVELLQEASISPLVSEIRATIYRAANNSRVVAALSNAARNGKKVTAMVELLARFDESSNILISQTLKDNGVNVLTGQEGFKIHGKIVYIKLKNKKDIAVISTGNFHEGNAKQYTDCLLFTSNPKIVNEVKGVFDLIMMPYDKHNFMNLLVSPLHMEKVFEKLIKNEIKNRKLGLPSGIKIKINHITDKKMVKLLYNASNNGVKIDLLIRGNSSIVPGIKDVSENITVHGIIDRYLEHSRIFIFTNGGNKLYFMGSADWMPRNLYNRIEVVTPIYDKEIQKELELIVDYGLKDTAKSIIVTNDGKYLKNEPTGNILPFRSQEELYNYYKNK